jgi:hypothetical protein
MLPNRPFVQCTGRGGVGFDKIRRRFSWLELIRANGGYNARQVETLATFVTIASIRLALRRLDRA